MKLTILASKFRTHTVGKGLAGLSKFSELSTKCISFISFFTTFRLAGVILFSGNFTIFGDALILSRCVQEMGQINCVQEMGQVSCVQEMGQVNCVQEKGHPAVESKRWDRSIVSRRWDRSEVSRRRDKSVVSDVTYRQCHRAVLSGG